MIDSEKKDAFSVGSSRAQRLCCWRVRKELMQFFSVAHIFQACEWVTLLLSYTFFHSINIQRILKDRKEARGTGQSKQRWRGAPEKSRNFLWTKTKTLAKLQVVLSTTCLCAWETSKKNIKVRFLKLTLLWYFHFS